MGRRHSHPGHFTSSSSFKVKQEDGSAVNWHPLTEVPSGEILSEFKSQIRKRNSIRHAQEKDMEAIGERTIEEEMAKLPIWYTTLTLRSLIVAAILGACFSIISLKLSLTTGIIPSLNIAAGLLGFFFIQAFIKIFGRFKWGSKPFTKQENTVIQTCVVACYGMAFNGGFGTYLLAMDQQSYENVGETYPGNRPEDVYNPTLARSIPYLYSVSLLGIFFLLPLRNLFIIKYNLPYPSGTATGLMINSFFTEAGSEIARLQVLSMFKWFCFSFIFDFWKWFFTANGDCGDITGGFDSFPTFSIQAYEWTWYFNFEQNYIGVGMLCPWIVDYSVMFGAIISWGLMWPLIAKQEGNWYPAGLSGNSFEGLYAYKTFTAIALFIGDGIYILLKLLVLSYMNYREQKKQMELDAKIKSGDVQAPGSTNDDSAVPLEGTTSKSDNVPDADKSPEYTLEPESIETPQERALRERIFITDEIPWFIGVVGYVVMLIVATIAIPFLYPPAKWYMCLLAGCLSPLLAFANAYGAGLTDWNMASLYGKLFILIFAAWGGVDNGGVISGLAVCGIAFASISAASDLMQDFRTGYLTCSSPRAMFVAQIVGALMGCVIAPLCFLLFYNGFPVGVPGTLYAAPYGTVYRGMSVLGAQGFSSLPDHCVELMAGFFGIAFALNLARDFLPPKYGRFIPLPMAVALTFYLGAWLAVSMVIGGLIVLVWRWLDRRRGTDECSLYSAVIASGLIAGDGIWSIPSAILAIAGVSSPICMGFSKGTP